MIWYTVRLNSNFIRYFTTIDKAREWTEEYKQETGIALTIIERRTHGDTEKPETYT